MIQDLEEVQYRRGLLAPNIKPKDLPVKSWRLSKIPAEARKLIIYNDLLNLGGVHGEKKLADPVQYDHLKLVLTDDTVDIKVYNRAVMLGIFQDEKVKRIHQVLCKLGG